MQPPNKKGGWCTKCKNWVINGQGYAVVTYGSGWKIIHKHCYELNVKQEKERLALAMKLAAEKLEG